MEMEARDYLYCLELHFDIDAQLAAIRALLRHHRDQSKAVDEEIARLGEHARRVTGNENEPAAEEWTDRVHRSAYLGAAHSMAAVGMLAPLVETLFHGIFKCIGAQFFSTCLPANMYLRSAASGGELWDCHFVFDGTKQEKKDLTSGIMQLAKVIGLSDKLPSALEQTLSALFSYRNSMFHNGFEWPLDERVKFAQRIRSKGWPSDWFSTATSDDEPWIFYFSEQYIEHCLEMIDQVLDTVGAFIRDDLLRDPQVPGIG
jgi:hypothetical protein